jgi:hypothetical protein
MAKAKKPEPKKPSGAAAASKKKHPAPSSQLVDTNLAAQSAARMLFANRKRENAPESKPASGGLIDQLKAEINKHPSATVAGMLDKSAPAGARKPNLPFDRKQVAHNQTHSGDITRSGVPRRTPG